MLPLLNKWETHRPNIQKPLEVAQCLFYRFLPINPLLLEIFTCDHFYLASDAATNPLARVFPKPSYFR
jgi:hypothetical protein